MAMSRLSTQVTGASRLMAPHRPKPQARPESRRAPPSAGCSAAAPAGTARLARTARSDRGRRVPADLVALIKGLALGILFRLAADASWSGLSESARTGAPPLRP